MQKGATTAGRDLLHAFRVFVALVEMRITCQEDACAALEDLFFEETRARVLEGLYATFGDPRYRPSPWLARRARLALSLSAPDRRN